MYPVSQEYKNKIKENSRIFKAIIVIQHSSGTLILTDKDIIAGTLIYNESSQSGEDFTVGAAVASDISFEILNKPEYENINFDGATVIPTIALLLSRSYIENYFLSAPQPSEYESDEANEIWEYINLGIFNIDDPIKTRNSIKIKAIDNMIEFDKPYYLSNLNYPATLYQIYVNACNVCDVQVGTLNFPNKDYVVKERPAGDYTFRDIISYVAELAGCFARCNRNGALEIKWYSSSNLTLGPENRFNFYHKDFEVQIKGVMATVDNNIYLAGTDEYAIDLSNNPLLQDNYENVLPVIYNNVKDTIYIPFTSDWQGDPAIQAGDIITQIDRDGKAYNTIVTHSTYKYRGASTLAARGLPTKAKGYKGSTNKTITNIIRKEIKPIGDQLTTIEQAQLDATRLIANMLGGYAIRTEDAFYIADSPNLSNAQKVWKWGIGGFGYSSTGISGPYTTAITAEGSIVANLVSAGIVTANMIQTGILQSEDGSVWINLDNNSFNFKNEIIWNSETNKVVFGNNVTLSWNNLTDTPTILTDNDVTTITNNTISTTNILAQNLKVKSANIEGQIIADSLKTTAEINVGTDAIIGNNLRLGNLSDGTTKGIYFQNESYITNNSQKMTIYARQGFDIYANNGNLNIGVRDNSGFKTIVTGSGGVDIVTASNLTNDITVRATRYLNLETNNNGGTGIIYYKASGFSSYNNRHEFQINGSKKLEINSSGVDFLDIVPANLRSPAVQDKANTAYGIEFRYYNSKLQYKRTNSSTWIDIV